jgi:hypothetical protein
MGWFNNKPKGYYEPKPGQHSGKPTKDQKLGGWHSCDMEKESRTMSRRRRGVTQFYKRAYCSVCGKYRGDKHVRWG